MAGYYPDSSQRLICSCCGNDGGVLHRCPRSSPLAPPRWLPLLLAGIKIVCPGCSAGYDLGGKIEVQDPEAGEVIKNGALFIGTLFLISAIADLLRGKKRRR